MCINMKQRIANRNDKGSCNTSDMTDSDRNNNANWDTKCVCNFNDKTTIGCVGQDEVSTGNYSYS